MCITCCISILKQYVNKTEKTENETSEIKFDKIKIYQSIRKNSKYWKIMYTYRTPIIYALYFILIYMRTLQNLRYELKLFF